jgi:hypothetical protein
LLLLPVLWGISARGLSVIVGHLYWKYYVWLTSPAPERDSHPSLNDDDDPREDTALTASARQTRNYGAVQQRAAVAGPSIDGRDSRILVENRRKLTKRWEYSHYVVQLLLLLAWGLGGVLYGARIPKYETGLAGGENCGHYKLLNSASDVRKIEDDRMVQEPKEARAAYYAKQCYQGDGLVASPDLCGTFYKQSIPYRKENFKDRACPFLAPEICAEPYAAIQFTTDIFPTSILGINSPKASYARRKTICSPLNVSEPYVTTSSSERDGKRQTRYWYGKTEVAGWTFNTSGDPFDSDFPVYAVK